MAHNMVTTAELLQLADGNISDIDVSELLEDAPLLQRLSAITASNSTLHSWLKKTGAPGVGFRAINDGRDVDKAVYTRVEKTLQLFDASTAIDIGLLKAQGGEALKRREAVDHLQAAFADTEGQIYYGTDKHATGFTGFAQETACASLAGAKVINAGGTTLDTASSVWLIRSGEAAVSAVYGMGGQIMIEPEYPTTMAGSSTGIFDAMRTPILYYGAVQVSTTHDLVRIANVTEDNGAELTDDLISQAIALFPAGRGPSFMMCTRRSLQQLQASRTATNATGAPAPFPTEAFGVPIYPTDQLLNTEALLT